MGFFSSIGKILGTASDTIGGGLLSGGLSLLGGTMQNSSARAAASDANAFTKEQLQNRHQWEVADLKKAGLNPILSAGSAPSIGGASTADVPSNALGNAVSSAMQMKQLNATIDNLSATTEKAIADAGAARSSDALNREAVKTQKTQQFVNAQLGKLYDANALNVGLDSSKKAVESAVYNSALDPVRNGINAGKKAGSYITDKIGQNIFDAWNYFQKGK